MSTQLPARRPIPESGDPGQPAVQQTTITPAPPLRFVISAGGQVVTVGGQAVSAEAVDLIPMPDPPPMPPPDPEELTGEFIELPNNLGIGGSLAYRTGDGLYGLLGNFNVLTTGLYRINTSTGVPVQVSSQLSSTIPYTRGMTYHPTLNRFIVTTDISGLTRWFLVDLQGNYSVYSALPQNISRSGFIVTAIEYDRNRDIFYILANNNIYVMSTSGAYDADDPLVELGRDYGGARGVTHDFTNDLLFIPPLRAPGNLRTVNLADNNSVHTFTNTTNHSGSIGTIAHDSDADNLYVIFGNTLARGIKE